MLAETIHSLPEEMFFLLMVLFILLFWLVLYIVVRCIMVRIQLSRAKNNAYPTGDRMQKADYKYNKNVEFMSFVNRVPGAASSSYGKLPHYQLTISKTQASEGCVIDNMYSYPDICFDCGGRGSTDKATVPCPTCGGTGKEKFEMPPEFSGVLQDIPFVGNVDISTAICRTCLGRGVVPQNPCKACGGTGSIIRPYPIRIPAGIKNGELITLPILGNMKETLQFKIIVKGRHRK